MSLVLRGNEFVASEALSVAILSGLTVLAARRPVIINGIKMCAQDLKRLAEEARRSKVPVWPGAHASCAVCRPNEG
jgi:hypothetical protein